MQDLRVEALKILIYSQVNMPFVIKKNFIAPFYRWALTVYHSVPKSFWYSFNEPRKDERLTWP